ncbi:MAG: Type IV secretion system protein VirB6 [Legionellaceae bacterium]
MSHIYNDIMIYINSLCNNYISSYVVKIAEAISPTAYTLLSIYIILWGFICMRGLIQEPIMDGLIRIIKIVFIFSIAIKLGNYNVYVTDVFFKTPEELALVLTKLNTEKTTVNALDILIDKGFSIGKLFWEKGGILNGDIGMYLIGFIIYLLTIAVTAYTCFLIILAKIALSLIISLGPIFILTLLFQPTANFFNAWVQQLANYFLLILLVIITNIFFLHLFIEAANVITNSAQWDVIFPFLIIGAISLLILSQLPSLASSLSGGVALSTYGIEKMGFSMLNQPFQHVIKKLIEHEKETHSTWNKKNKHTMFRKEKLINSYRDKDHTLNNK